MLIKNETQTIQFRNLTIHENNGYIERTLIHIQGYGWTHKSIIHIWMKSIVTKLYQKACFFPLKNSIWTPESIMCIIFYAFSVDVWLNENGNPIHPLFICHVIWLSVHLLITHLKFQGNSKYTSKLDFMHSFFASLLSLCLCDVSVYMLKSFEYLTQD